MDHKDFKRHLTEKLKETLSKSQSTYHFKQRQSRPRAKENIINPNLKGI
jgi:hypothetical protein